MYCIGHYIAAAAHVVSLHKTTQKVYPMPGRHNMGYKILNILNNYEAKFMTTQLHEIAFTMRLSTFS
jgi:hypothetical protein